MIKPPRAFRFPRRAPPKGPAPLQGMVPQWMMSVRLVLAIGLLALTGCGGGTDGTPAAPPPTAPTPAEPPPTPPGQPSGLRVVDVGLDFLVWTWDPVETATGYEGHAFPDGTPVSERPPLQVTVEPTFRADGLEPGTAMVFFVRAIRETAGGRAAGPRCKCLWVLLRESALPIAVAA